MRKGRKLSKRSFAREIEKSTRTVERWIATGIIPNNWVYRDATGHIFIHEMALDHLFSKHRHMEARYDKRQAFS